jgi:hypothetical protein
VTTANLSIDTDAQGRPLPAVAPFLGRRSSLRYSGAVRPLALRSPAGVQALRLVLATWAVVCPASRPMGRPRTAVGLSPQKA